MTSTIIIDASSAPEQSQGAGRTVSSRPRAVHAKLGFGGVLRSEWIKLSSLRSIRITLLLTVLGGLGLSGLMSLMWSQQGIGMFGSGPAALQGYLLFGPALLSSFLALVFGVLGVFAISSEYSSGMILSTLTAVPKRTSVFVAKMLVLAGLSVAAALVIFGGGLGVAVAFMPDAAAQLGSPAVVSGTLGAIAYLTLVALFAFGVSALLRSTAGGIAVVAGVSFVLPIVMQLMTMTGWSWVPEVSSYLPGSLGSRLAQGVTETAAAAPAGPGFGLAFAAMVLWAAVVVIPALLAFKRRDAK
ncbi:ABC transporter permease subunit [Leucobacter massiliensis]|uniref:ABC transporter permease n=1 Tax=Leucobacter massiliensis TaxID=1686285 RepID=A0A2S9QQ23_9MICO|nr:ABC transporter permease subunit [Leucobacter massiliensis]PRI11689.1 ABC transporter permease [Leucobacter massiliensis]